MGVKFIVRLGEIVRIGLNTTATFGPFDSIKDAVEFADSTQTWAIPPDRKRITIHSILPGH